MENLLTKYFFCLFLIAFVLSFGCGKVASNEQSSDKSGLAESEWLISKGEVFRAQGKDGIPSIDQPQFAPVNQIDYVDNDRKVLGIKVGNEIRAYPHQILDWHEIVNDEIEGKNRIAVTYCPLTGTGIAWERSGTEFGVSGLLFRNNLILYDRSTDSKWSQMQMRAVNGPRSEDNTGNMNVIETTWKTWKLMYPDSKVLTTNTGYDRNYQSFAYGSAILYPIKNIDNRLEKRVRVHGVIASKIADEGALVRAYEIRKFGEDISLIYDQLQKEQIILVGSAEMNFVVSFKATLNGSLLDFEPIHSSLPIVMKDQEGNKWDVFGTAVEGPREGEQLTPVKSYTGYWFAWADFFPTIEIYEFD